MVVCPFCLSPRSRKGEGGRHASGEDPVKPERRHCAGQKRTAREKKSESRRRRREEGRRIQRATLLLSWDCRNTRDTIRVPITRRTDFLLSCHTLPYQCCHCQLTRSSVQICRVRCSSSRYTRPVLSLPFSPPQEAAAEQRGKPARRSSSLYPLQELQRAYQGAQASEGPRWGMLMLMLVMLSRRAEAAPPEHLLRMISMLSR